MGKYSPFDYLCNEPISIDGIGRVKCPTLREIRKITNEMFSIYSNIVTTSLDDYLKMCGLQEKYETLSDEEKRNNNLFNLIFYGNPLLLFGLLDFFLVDKFEINQTTSEIDIYEYINDTKNIVGHLNHKNFDIFREELQCLLGIKKTGQTELKFKNSLAEKMFAKLKKHEQQNKKSDENLELDNMIKKYCTHNKVGINILNVWDMTYYQFSTMFSEYCNGRQYDFNDMMAASTFQYKKSSDYKPADYMKKLNK